LIVLRVYYFISMRSFKSSLQAIDEYVQKWQKAALAAEAQRQSMLVSAKTTDDEEYWENQADFAGGDETKEAQTS
jgi:hypothetical protein